MNSRLLLDPYLACIDTQLPQLPQSDAAENFNTLFSAVQVLAAQVSRASYFPALCSVDLPVGTYVAVFDDTGVAKIKPADGSDVSLFAVGFLTTAGVAGSFAVVCISGINMYTAGLSPGKLYYLSQSLPGTITATMPVSGPIQQVGVALAEDKLLTTLVQYIAP